MIVIKDELNEDGSHSLSIREREVFRGSQEEAEGVKEAVVGVTAATLGLGTVGLGWVIDLLVVTNPLAYILILPYLVFCVLVANNIEKG